MSPSQSFFIKHLTVFILTLFHIFLPPIIREIPLLGLIQISNIKYVIFIQFLVPSLMWYGISLLYSNALFGIVYFTYLIIITIIYTYFIRYISNKYIINRIPKHILNRYTNPKCL